MRISWCRRGWGLVPSISAPARMITVRSGELAVGAGGVDCARLSCHGQLARQRAAARARLPTRKTDRIFLTPRFVRAGEYSDCPLAAAELTPSLGSARCAQKGTDRFANTLRPGKVQYRGVPAA